MRAVGGWGALGGRPADSGAAREFLAPDDALSFGVSMPPPVEFPWLFSPALSGSRFGSRPPAGRRTHRRAAEEAPVPLSRAASVMDGSRCVGRAATGDAREEPARASMMRSSGLPSGRPREVAPRRRAVMEHCSLPISVKGLLLCAPLSSVRPSADPGSAVESRVKIAYLVP